MEMPKNQFKAGLAAGTVQIGLWSTLCSNTVAEVIGDSGFDWVLLDTEHTPNELPDLVSQMQALATGTASTIVRPAWNDAVLIKRLLDSGAQSLLIPFVQNEAEAKAAVAATRYPPHGIRGVTGSGRGSRYGRVKNYFQSAHEEIVVIVQIESGVALDEIDAIAAVDGVDAVFIGPSDLSASLGHIGNARHEEVQTAIKRGMDQLKAVGKPAGILAFNREDAARYIQWGATFVAVASDLSLLRGAADQLAASYREMNSA